VIAGISKRAKEVAKEKKLPLFRVHVDGRFEPEPFGSLDASGTCTPEEARELLDFLKRWSERCNAEDSETKKEGPAANA
jgi:hypothetical protein